VTRRAKVYILLLVIACAGAIWGVVRLLSEPTAAPPTAATTPPSTETAHITATLYYGSSDGRSLVAVRRDVPLATGVVEQGRQILNVLLQDAPQPYAQVLPKGTKLRAFYVTERGDAFVDLSGDVVSGHPGGSLGELLTVYAIVNAVTGNLPAIQRVQLLVEGREVDTIAGHIDVRRPLERDMTIVRDGRGEAPGAQDSNPKK
jgi:hypothetical protein